MSFSSFTGSGRQAVYLFYEQGAYKIPRYTSSPGVVPDIPYFVPPSFPKSYPYGSYALRRVEESVVSEYKDMLLTKCARDKQRRNTLIQRVCLNVL